jgi:hypothetical protein
MEELEYKALETYDPTVHYSTPHCAIKRER